MAKIDVTKTELVWAGKYNEDGTRREVPRVSLPFQVIETIQDSRATRDAIMERAQPGLFDTYHGTEGDTFERGWRNKLIWGDNLLVSGALSQSFAGKIDLIYIDPPFATGADFSFTTQIGEEAYEIEKDQSVIEEKAYRDTWGRGINSYLGMMYDRLSVMYDLLSDKGSIYVHLDWHFGHYVKIILDEIFGTDGFRNEIIREKTNPKNYTKQGYGNIHDVIFYYAKSSSAKWVKPYIERSDDKIKIDFPHIDKNGYRYKTAPLHAPGIRRGDTGKPWRGLMPPPGNHWRYIPATLDSLDEEERIEWSSTGNPRERVYAHESAGMFLQDIWMGVKDTKGEYPSMKNPEIVERLIRASSEPGDLVADFFGGSGTTVAIAERLGRRWITCDLGRFAIHTTRKRLLSIKDCKPFEVLNLGKYERQYWQGLMFGTANTITERSLYEYLAFVLKLYKAEPVSGLAHIHGRKGAAMVHIGSVDAPVTIEEINLALAECIQLKQKQLHVLGWDWEMGLYELVPDEAKKQGIKLTLLQIPNEAMEQQAVDKGHLQFFELAYIKANVEQTSSLIVVVNLQNFVIPNTELIPEEVRERIKAWSDYVDYWAVDWDFRNDTFMQGWVTYRSRQDRSLALSSDPHTYKKPGTYRILVKVIDIFGNDTSQVFSVEVK